MKLNHINLPVADVAATRAFFEAHFGFVCTDVKGENALAVMTGEDGFVLVLMSLAFNRTEATVFPSAFHIGFLLPTRLQVTEQYNKLKAAAVPLQNEPGNMRGIYGFYFMAPGDILVEVSSDEHE